MAAAQKLRLTFTPTDSIRDVLQAIAANSGVPASRVLGDTIALVEPFLLDLAALLQTIKQIRMDLAAATARALPDVELPALVASELEALAVAIKEAQTFLQLRRYQAEKGFRSPAEKTGRNARKRAKFDASQP